MPGPMRYCPWRVMGGLSAAAAATMAWVMTLPSAVVSTVRLKGEFVTLFATVLQVKGWMKVAGLPALVPLTVTLSLRIGTPMGTRKVAVPPFQVEPDQWPPVPAMI